MDLAQMTLYVAFCCATAEEFLPSPSQPRCVFIAYDNVTCNWTPGKNSPAGTFYSLHANFSSPSEHTLKWMHAFSCTRTNQTHCSGPMRSPDRLYSVRVIAQNSAATASSATLYVHALDTVKLRRPDLSDLRPVREKPRCLELQWHKPVKYALIHENICSGLVTYQLQYSSDDQIQTVEGRLGEHLEPAQCEDSLRTNRTVPLRSPCSLSPFTKYTVWLRLRYLSIWSEWSNHLQGCTGTADFYSTPNVLVPQHRPAPISAPQVWRRLKPAEDLQRRRVTLLWKPPLSSQTACASLWFNAYCQSEESHNATLRTGRCLNVTSTSCQLTLPMERSSYFLTLCNSAGSSPAAQLTLPAPADTLLKTMKTVSVKTLNDSSLELSWSSLTHASLTGFLLEWEPVTKAYNRDLWWERVDRNTNSMLIAGLLSEVRYVVTVRPEFGSEHGEAASVQTYTRQGVPSAGPRMQVKEQSNSAVLVAWHPPPVEERHGFITQYSLYYQKENSLKSEVLNVSGETLDYRLSGLSGVYQIYVTAHTSAGEGPAGPPQWVTVDVEDSKGTILVCVLLFVFALVFLIFITTCRQRIKLNICPPVPDPALSSLTAWISSSERAMGSLYSEGDNHASTSELTKELDK